MALFTHLKFCQLTIFPFKFKGFFNLDEGQIQSMFFPHQIFTFRGKILPKIVFLPSVTTISFEMQHYLESKVRNPNGQAST